MADISKISPDDGSTILNIKDSNAVHGGEQSKGYVGKNLIQNTAVNSKHYDVTFVINKDKSITLNGTQNTSSEHINVVIGIVTLKAGKYIVTGTNRGAKDVAFQITDYPVTQQLFRIYSGDTEITLNSDTTIAMRIPVSGGATFNNFTLYPMIRLASVSDSTYEPYLTPNTEIDNKVSYVDNTVLGAKNLLSYPYNSQMGVLTRGGITITISNDGSLSLNGTSNASQEFDIHRRVANNDMSDLYLAAGNYIYSVDENLEDSDSEIHVGATKNGAYFELGKTTSNHELRFTVPSDLTGFNYTKDGKLLIAVYIGWTKSNVTYNNKKFKPMIRLAADLDDTYQAYTMSNRELTEKTIAKMSSASNTILGAKNLLKYSNIIIHPINGGDDITINDNGDNGITISGTKTSGHWTDIRYDCNIKLLAGVTYQLSCLGIPNNVKGIRLSDNTGYIFSMENGVTHTTYISQTDKILTSWQTTIATGDEAEVSFTYYPMLYPALDIDDTYAPYAMTNRELTDIFTNKIIGFYAKRINLPATSIRYITAEFGYQPIFMIGQRNLGLLFCNLGSSVSSKTICRDADSDVPSIEFEATKKTKITNNVNAELSFLVLSYGDFTLSES